MKISIIINIPHLKHERLKNWALMERFGQISKMG
jgi:hypothetical protein